VNRRLVRISLGFTAACQLHHSPRRKERAMNGVNHCGAYLEHLQAVHQRLNGKLQEIRHRLAHLVRGQEQAAVVAEIRQWLRDLRTELRSHFAREEGGGCLEEAAARCPSLSTQIKELLEHHPRLTQALEQLIAGTKEGTANRAAWQERFHAFVTQLKAHEAAESRVVQLGLGGDASEYDAEGNE